MTYDPHRDALRPGIPWLTLALLAVIIIVGWLWPWVGIALLLVVGVIAVAAGIA